MRIIHSNPHIFPSALKKALINGLDSGKDVKSLVPNLGKIEKKSRFNKLVLNNGETPSMVVIQSHFDDDDDDDDGNDTTTNNNTNTNNNNNNNNNNDVDADDENLLFTALKLYKNILKRFTSKIRCHKRLK